MYRPQKILLFNTYIQCKFKYLCTKLRRSSSFFLIIIPLGPLYLSKLRGVIAPYILDQFHILPIFTYTLLADHPYCLYKLKGEVYRGTVQNFLLETGIFKGVRFRTNTFLGSWNGSGRFTECPSSLPPSLFPPSLLFLYSFSLSLSLCRSSSPRLSLL